MAVDDPVIGLAVGRSGVEQFAARKGAPRLLRHMREDFEFRRRQRDPGERLIFLVAAAHHARIEFDHQLADRQCPSPERSLRATEHRADALDHFGRIERFGDVIVRAHPERGQFRHLVVERGDHDDRRVRPAADGDQRLQPVAAGQADIEQDEVGMRLSMRADRLLHVGRARYVEAAALDIGGQQVGDLPLILDEENMVGHPVPFVA
jgi:hypothetical protein